MNAREHDEEHEHELPVIEQELDPHVVLGVESSSGDDLLHVVPPSERGRQRLGPVHSDKDKKQGAEDEREDDIADGEERAQHVTKPLVSRRLWRLEQASVTRGPAP